MKYWLMKSEPESYSITDLKRDGTAWWEGVRNYQARNYMMNDMAPGDLVLFYHSNADPTGISGTAVISKKAEADKSAFDKKSEYYDPKSTKENPIWHCTQVQFKSLFKSVLTLEEIKHDPALKGMLVIKRGMRLSIQPVDKKHFQHILKIKE